MQPSWETHICKSRLSGQVRVLDHGVLKIVWRCLKQGVPDWAERLQTISGVVVGQNGWKTSESNMRDGLMGLDLFETFLNLNNGDISVDLEGMEIVPLNSRLGKQHMIHGGRPRSWQVNENCLLTWGTARHPGGGVYGMRPSFPDSCWTSSCPACLRVNLSMMVSGTAVTADKIAKLCRNVTKHANCNICGKVL